MKARHVIAALGAVVLFQGLLTVTAGSAAAAGTYQYSFQEHGASDSFTDTGLCDPGPAQIDLTDYNEAFHVSASTPGLTQDQVEALLENDPNGVITKVTYTQTGSFRVTEADGHVYVGHFTNWFGGSINKSTMVFSGIFNVNGTSDDGRTISGHFNSHETFRNDAPVISFDKGDITGC
jgi:hypothetical protein